MASMLKALWSRFVGGGTADAAAEAVEYNGYRIRPAPYASKGQYQTAGTIEKEVAGERKEHRFIRAEFSIAKAKQIIDEQGERIFRQAMNP